MSGERIPVAKPSLGDEEVAAAERVIRSGWVTQGPEVAAFEREFAAWVGAPHAAAASSCTTAMHLALLAVGVGPGDEVIAPSHSFVATANAIRMCGATPVFADVELATFNLDPADVAARITPRTRALLVVHQLGMPCELERLLELARAHGLRLIEDAACAAGSELRWQGAWERVGRPRGDAACFSFHPRKLLTCGDGGMITTQDAELAEACRRMRHHGMSVPDTVRHASESVIFEAYTAPGYNYRLTDIQAAVGRAQLAKLEGIVRRRRELVEVYREALREAAHVILPHEPAWARSNWQSFCVRLAPSCPRGQREVMQALLEAGISTRRGVMCSHLEPAYADAPHTGLERSAQARDTGLVLPLFEAMTEAQVQRVAAELRRVTEA